MASASRVTTPLSARPKPRLSCNPCRRKKIKCDRKRPCSKCATLHPHCCIYPETIISAPPARPKRLSGLHERIDRLESLLATKARLLDTSHTSNHEASETSEHVDDTSENSAQLSDNGVRTRFLKPSHWESFLDEIAGIRDELLEAEKLPERPMPAYVGRPLLLFGMRNSCSASELICSLPSRDFVEALTNHFFNETKFLTLLVVVHIPTFKRECEVFWQNPASATLPWLALLYAVLCLALQDAQNTNSKVADIYFPEETARIYATKAAQCLIESDYTKPTTTTIQAMILYLGTEHRENIDNSFGAKVVFTTIVQQAYYLNFHRDPRNLKGMSFLECEIQRRIWAFIVQMDHIFSEKCGLPRSIDGRQTDTMAPMNLLDQDLENLIVMPPPARPDSEPTAISFMTYRMKALKVQGEIVNRTNLHERLTFDEVIRLDQSLSEVETRRPLWLSAMGQLDKEVAQDPWLHQIVQIDLTFYRARMLLHRNYPTTAPSEMSYSYSRSACRQAAEKVLAYQDLVCGHGMYGDTGRSNWRFFALVNHEFLLAAMIVCLDINQDLKTIFTTPATAQAARLESATKIKLLLQSHKNWIALAQHSEEARKGATVVGAMVEQVRRHGDSAKSKLTAIIPMDSHNSYDEGDADSLSCRPFKSWPSGGLGLDSASLVRESGTEMELRASEHLTSTYDESISAASFLSNIGMCDTMADATQTEVDWTAWDALYPGISFDF